MKKIYREPSIEQTKISITRMLCLSGGLGGDATGPARSRQFWGLDEEEESNAESPFQDTNNY